MIHRPRSDLQAPPSPVLAATWRCSIIVLGIALAGCVTTDLRVPVPAQLVDEAKVENLDSIRYWGDGDVLLTSEAINERVRALRASSTLSRKRTVSYLAVSGGGSHGAFGAGLLVGWTASGKRPVFEAVTGVSTGAMIAPMAFLGSRYDGMLREAYTTVTTKQIAKPQVLPALLGASPALASTKPLAALIARYMTAEMLTEIAAEHQKGRRLFIGTTNLDAQRPVIWDIGAIANSGSPRALQLTREIILASASIPGAFPPVQVNVDVGGKQYQEMHVDGGVTNQVFLYPPEFHPTVIDKALGYRPVRHAYIIRNSKIGPEYKATKEKLLPISARSMDTLIKTQGIGDLYRIYLTAKRDHIGIDITYIPEDFDLKSKEAFDPVYMTALFDLGYQFGKTGTGWHKAPPGF